MTHPAGYNLEDYEPPLAASDGGGEVTADHHDAELCKRLAINVMGWTLKPNSAYRKIEEMEDHGSFVDNDGKHVYWRNIWNPCCNPAHWWMLVQKMTELGHDIHNEYDSLHKGWFVQIWIHGSPRPIFDGTRYKSLLHATALAANEVKDD